MKTNFGSLSQVRLKSTVILIVLFLIPTVKNTSFALIVNEYLIQQENKYTRTYSDYFVNTAAVYQFLMHHSFTSKSKSILSYNQGILTIKSSRATIQFINIEIVSYNQDRAIIRGMFVGQGNYSATFMVNAINGTVTDNDGTVYRTAN